jgi:uncharacterized protein YbjQ (UPF0145 family)
MPWFTKKSPSAGPDAAAIQAAMAAADQRIAAWDAAINSDRLPDFVTARLSAAANGKTPWLATMTPAELLLIRSHGLRPLATVTGTCWFQFGRSWTEGHATGWQTALRRLKAEAVACGATAVVDVKMRTAPGGASQSMDYSLIGTAVRLKDLPANPDPVVATVPAIEFVRLLEAEVVPTGIAVGAYYEWLSDNFGMGQVSNFTPNQPLTGLTKFWERARRRAHQALRDDAKTQGNGVLAHTHFGQLLKAEVENGPNRYLGRHIVIGTVVDCRPGRPVPHSIEMVLDMRDDLSPMLKSKVAPRNAYATNDREAEI